LIIFIPTLIFQAHASFCTTATSPTLTNLIRLIQEIQPTEIYNLAAQSHCPEKNISMGIGSDVTIRELVETIMRVMGVEARTRFDASKPDGTPRKLMDSERLFATGWRPKTRLEDGLRMAYAWYSQRRSKIESKVHLTPTRRYSVRGSTRRHGADHAKRIDIA
jgi:dTDP-D-glucose 4,6-dehydratase